MLKNISSHGNFEVRYSTSPVSIEIDTSCAYKSDAYPVSVTVIRVKNEQSTGMDSVGIPVPCAHNFFTLANIPYLAWQWLQQCRGAYPREIRGRM